MAVEYKIGTKRIVSRFVIRKRIGEEVKWFCTATWEEEYQSHSDPRTEGWSRFNEFTPLYFVAVARFHELQEPANT